MAGARPTAAATSRGSTTGTTTMTTRPHKLHADLRGLQFLFYRGQETLFLPTDGGTYMSTNGGASVSNINLKGLMNAQIYSTWSSDSNPDLFLAGSQDQGLQRTIPPRGNRGSRAGAPRRARSQWISGDYGEPDLGLPRPVECLRLLSRHALRPPFAGGRPELGRLRLPAADDRRKLLRDVGRRSRRPVDRLRRGRPHLEDAPTWETARFRAEPAAAEFLAQRRGTTSRRWPSRLPITTSGTPPPSRGTSGPPGTTAPPGPSRTPPGMRAPTTRSARLRCRPTDPFTCFAGGSGYGTPPVLVTHDGGASWSPLSEGLPSTAGLVSRL